LNEFQKFFIKITRGLIWLFIVFSPVFFFNFAIDPYGIFLDLNKKSEMEPNKRYLKLCYILKNPDKYDSFIFGSSRANFIDPVKIPGGKYFNMALANGVPRYHLEDIKLMVRKGIKIKNLLIGIDFLSLLINPEIQENDLSRKHYPVSLVEKFDFYKRYLFFRPDWKTVKLSLSTNGFDRATLLSNGIRVYNNFDSSIELNPEAHVKAEKFQTPRARYSISSDINGALDQVKKLVQFAKEHQINLIFYINPTHHITYLNLNLDNYYEALKKLADLTNFYDFSGLNSVAIDNMSFLENSHFRLKTGDMIIARIFHKDNISLPDDFGRYITRLNVDDEISFHRALLLNYMKATSLKEDTNSCLNFYSLKKTRKKLNCTLDRINGIQIKNPNKPLLITTPWIKIKGYDIAPALKIP